MIGIFDSGSGGLTVLQAVRARLPCADFVYFGDTKNVPYGNKSNREIKELVAASLIKLRTAGAEYIINACHTASSVINNKSCNLIGVGEFNMVDMLEPNVSALIKCNKKTVIFCTRLTADSGAYQRRCEEVGVDVSVIALPELAGLIENGASAEILRPVIGAGVRLALDEQAQVLSLGCTHFPLVRDLFEEYVRDSGSTVEVFDPSDTVAEAVALKFPHEGNGSIQFLLSAPSHAFERHVRQLFSDIPYTIRLAV